MDTAIAQRTGDAGGPPSFIFRHLLHKDAKFSKLSTREDKYGIHKTLGILSVLSFIYRYGYVYNVKGTLGFDGMRSKMRFYFLDWATMLIHLLLACSSIIFRVPKRRISNKPMVIYEEYRQHAMVFTFRCFVVFSLAYLIPDDIRPGWCVPLGVMVCHLLADRITSIHGTPGNTAVRATQKRMKISTFYRYVGKLYSLYQFLAIGSHILPNVRLADLGYNAIIAIQSSAFMMTLYRKRIVRGRTHMVVYSFCLIVSAFHIIRLLGYRSVLLVIGAFLTRINLPRKYSNKYVIWGLFLVASNVNWNNVVAAAEKFQASAPATTFEGMALTELVSPTQGTALAALAYALFYADQALVVRGDHGANNRDGYQSDR